MKSNYLSVIEKVKMDILGKHEVKMDTVVQHDWFNDTAPFYAI